MVNTTGPAELSTYAAAFLPARAAAGIGIAGSLLTSTASQADTGGLPGLAALRRRKRSASSICTNPARPRRSIFSITSPRSAKLQGTELPATVRMGQRITGMTSGQSSLPVAKSIFKFSQHGKSGAWLSELLPHHGKIVDDIAIIKTTNTEAINHDPAITFIQTGSQQPGRPSFGSWVTYGLGSENQNLPAFVVLIAQSSAINTDQPLFSRLWGNGFLPSQIPGREFPRLGRSRCSIFRTLPGSTKPRAAACSMASGS